MLELFFNENIMNCMLNSEWLQWDIFKKCDSYIAIPRDRNITKFLLKSGNKSLGKSKKKDSENTRPII